MGGITRTNMMSFFLHNEINFINAKSDNGMIIKVIFFYYITACVTS